MTTGANKDNELRSARKFGHTHHVIVEDLALAMLVAIRDKDDDALNALTTDRIKGWPKALPQFAMEMRERFLQMTGEPFNMQVAQSVVEGDIAAVKCVGPKELNGTYLALFFVRTEAGWKNFSLRNSPPSVSLETQLRNAAKAIGVELPASQPATSAATQPSAAGPAEVYIMGEGVDRPGVYSLASGRKTTLKNLLATTGAISKQKGLAVTLVRSDPKSQDTRQTMLLEDILSGKAADIDLQHDDLIVVMPIKDGLPPATASRPAPSNEVYITGEVPRPGVYAMSEGLSLLRLLVAGGYKPGANGQRAMIITIAPDGRELQTMVNLDDLLSGKCPDPLLHGGDVVIVRPRDAKAGDSAPASQPATPPASSPAIIDIHNGKVRLQSGGSTLEAAKITFTNPASQPATSAATLPVP
jgi:protein involved in polysaccharide export with SLBB domain